MFRALQRLTLVLVAFTLTMNGVSVTIASLPVTPAKLIAFALLVMAALQMTRSRQGRGRDRKTVWVIAYTISYAIALAIDFAAGNAPAREILIDGSSHAALVLFYFLIAWLVTTRSDLVLLLWALVLGGAVTALPAVLGIEIGLVLDAEASRFQGLAGQSNVLGRDMAICLPIAAGLLLLTRSWPRRAILVAALFFIVGGLLLSLSRAAFLTAIAMGGLWMLRSGRVDSLKYAIPAVALALAVLLFAPDSVRDRWQTIVDPSRRATDTSIQSRVSQTEWGLRAFASNPLVGVGIQNYVYWVGEQPGGQARKDVLHNAYLGVAATQGLVGLVPYLILLSLVWMDYSRARRNARRQRGDGQLAELAHLATFLQIAFFGSLIYAFAHPVARAKTYWLLYALSTVALELVRRRVAALETETERPAAELEPLGPVAGLPLPPRTAAALPR